MNAYPIKTKPHDAIDELLAAYGAKTILVALLVRMLKRTRPPDSAAHARKREPHQLSILDDHIRADLGLPPSPKNTLQIDLMAINRHSIF